MVEYRLAESRKHELGENYCSWQLHTELYQCGRSCYYVILDKDDSGIRITSSVVSPATANALEDAITTALARPERLETLDDVYNELQKGFYGTMFKFQEIGGK
ncbi:MAG: hypothetical protein ACOYJ1_05525 [Peptococcales bacterium]|jgi:hypothetical protein